MPANRSITAYKGDTFIQPVTINEAGTDFSVGYTCRIQLRSFDRSQIISTVTPAIVAPSIGTCSFTWRLEASFTTTLAVGNYIYDIQFTKAGTPPTVVTYLQGQLIVSGDITDYD